MFHAYRLKWIFSAVLLCMFAVGQPVIAQMERTNRPHVEELLANQFDMGARSLIKGYIEDDPSTLYLLESARILMDMALELNPNDAERWRLRSELAGIMRNSSEQLNALKRYTRLQPEDDAAQSAMIMLMLDNLQPQTIDHRMAMVERILDSETGQQLSKPLRSRLASYIAVAAREQGNESLFRSWLRQAMREDATNYHAAMMTYELAIQHNATPPQIALALYGMLRANPVDPATHDRLGELLLAHGAYKQAAQQFEVAQKFRMEPSTERFYHSWAMSLAASGQRDQALRVIEEYEYVLRLTEQERANAQLGENETPVPVTGPFLSTDMQLLQFCIRVNPDHMITGTEGSFGRIRDKYNSEMQAGEPSAKSKLANLLVWFNQEPETVARLVNELATDLTEEHPVVRRLRGWQALHAGEKARVLELLEPIAADDAFAAYALAQIAGRPDSAERLRQLQLAINADPTSMAALLAARDMNAAGSEPKPTHTGAQILKLLDTRPFQIIKPNPEERPWVLVDLTITPEHAQFLEPVTATLELRNLTDYPLTFGPNGAIPENLIITVAPRRAGQAIGRIPPIVVDINRRLRLESRETMTIEVPLLRGPFAQIALGSIGSRVSYTSMAMLDPRIGPDGQFVPGPMGITDTQNLLEIGSGVPTMDHINKWISDVNEAVSHDRAIAIATMLQLYQSLREVEANREISQRMVQTILAAYPRMRPIEQAWTVMFIPPNDQGRADFQPILAEATRSNDPHVRISYLNAHVTEPQSTDMTSALRSEVPAIREYAQLHEKTITNLKQQQESAK